MKCLWPINWIPATHSYIIYQIVICKGYRWCRTGQPRLYWEEKVRSRISTSERTALAVCSETNPCSLNFCCVGVLFGTSLRSSYCPSPLLPPTNRHVTITLAGICWHLMFRVPNGFGVIVPVLWQHLALGIIYPTKSGPHLRLTFSIPYWRHIFFHDSYDIVVCHEHSCGVAQYKSNDWLIDWLSEWVGGWVGGCTRQVMKRIARTDSCIVCTLSLPDWTVGMPQWSIQMHPTYCRMRSNC